MRKATAESSEKAFPVCRLAMLVTCCVITLIGVLSGHEPFVIFMRMISGTLFVGVAVFLINLWFSSLFLQE